MICWLPHCPDRIAGRILLGVLILILLAPAVLAAIPMVWRLEREELAGVRRCAVVSLNGDVTARLEPPAVWSVTVGRLAEPGSVRYLRIDKQIYTTAAPRFEGAEAEAIVAGLSAPGVVAFEWARHPDYAKQAGLFGTGDFAAKAAACADWLQGERA